MSDGSTQRRRRGLVRDLRRDPPQATALDVVPLDSVEIAELATLMRDAYRGSVDDEGETWDDALAEICATLAGQYGPLISEASGAILSPAGLVSCIITARHQGGDPFVVYVMTDPGARKRGLATGLIEFVGQALQKGGDIRMGLAVTVGSAGESLYERLGFREA
jgi:GNAT superfamily N-acetyltransferase